MAKKKKTTNKRIFQGGRRGKSPKRKQNLRDDEDIKIAKRITRKLLLEERISFGELQVYESIDKFPDMVEDM